MSRFRSRSIQASKNTSTFGAWHRIDGMSCTQRDKSCFFCSTERKNKDERGGKKQWKAKKRKKQSPLPSSSAKEEGMGREHKHMSVKCGSREGRKDERGETRWKERGERSEAAGDKCLNTGFRENSYSVDILTVVHTGSKRRMRRFG